MAFAKGNKYGVKSKMEGMKRAKRYHACLDCRYSQHEIYKICPSCGSRNRQYFMSQAELHRGMMLLTLQAAGTIEKVRFQPRFELVVNGHKIATYTADTDYYKAGEYIVEDTKPKDFIDASALLKIKLFEALFNITVRIPQRASGDRHGKSLDLPLITRKE